MDLPDFCRAVRPAIDSDRSAARAPAIVTTIVDPKLSVHSVVFDGKYVWASGGYDNGVYILDRQGKVIAHVAAEHGLAGAYVYTPLDIGRVLRGARRRKHGRKKAARRLSAAGSGTGVAVRKRL